MNLLAPASGRTCATQEPWAYCWSRWPVLNAWRLWNRGFFVRGLAEGRTVLLRTTRSSLVRLASSGCASLRHFLRIASFQAMLTVESRA